MLMNNRSISLAVGFGALAIGLAAIPSNSARIQNPDKPAMEQLQASLAALKDRTEQASEKLSTEVQALENLQEVQLLQDPGENNLEILVGDGGSWLGVETKEVSAENVQQLKLPGERGALVGKIISDSPAAKAGLQKNDVITEINGQRVEGIAQFRRIIREIPAGRTAQLTVLRNGSAQTVSVTLGKSESRRTLEKLRAPSPGSYSFRVPETPEDMPAIAELGDLDDLVVAPDMMRRGPRLGIDAEDLQGELGAYFGAPEGHGVLIRSVHPDSPAAKAGLKSGDVITNVNGQRIHSIHELREQMHGIKDEKSLKIGLLRNKNEMSLNVVLPAPEKKETRSSGERAPL
jgi:serine protease Do